MLSKGCYHLCHIGRCEHEVMLQVLRRPGRSPRQPRLPALRKGREAVRMNILVLLNDRAVLVVLNTQLPHAHGANHDGRVRVSYVAWLPVRDAALQAEDGCEGS